MRALAQALQPMLKPSRGPAPEVMNIMAAILEKVHPKGEAEDDPIALEAYRKKQREMMDFGGARLVIDIIGCKPPAPRMLVEAAIDFGIEMLDLHNPDVQADMLEYLNNGRSDQFFFNCREYLIAAEKAIVIGLPFARVESGRDHAPKAAWRGRARDARGARVVLQKKCCLLEIWPESRGY